MVEILSSYTRTSAPGAPFPVAEGRVQLKNEEESFDDALITALIKAAGEMAEKRTGRAFMQSTWTCKLSDWKYDCNDLFHLYPAPLVSVTSIQYYRASDNTIQTLSTDDYRVHTSTEGPGFIEYLDDLPDLYDRVDAIVITFVAGYGASGANTEAQQAALPPDVVAWMKLQLATLYEYRSVYEKAGSGGLGLANIQTYADTLIYPYII